MNARQLIAELETTADMLAEWLRAGLPCRKVGRGRSFDREQVQQWLLANGHATGPRYATSIDQAAAAIGVDPRTISRWIKQGAPAKTAEGYDLDAIEAWNTDRQQAADPLLVGPQSEALEEYRRWKAKREQFAYERELGQWIRKSEIHDGLMLCMGVIRQAVDTLQRKFGHEAREIMAEAIDDALIAYHQTYGAKGRKGERST